MWRFQKLFIYLKSYTLQQTLYSFSTLFKYTFFILLSHLNIIFFIHSTHTQIGPETVNPSPRQANPHPNQRRDHQPKPTPSKSNPRSAPRPSTQAHAEQTHTQIGAETVNPSPRQTNPSLDPRRDRQPKPTPCKHGEQRESTTKRRKKNGRERKKSGKMKEKEKKKLK